MDLNMKLNFDFKKEMKDNIGKAFLAISFIIFIYMLVTPLDHLILHIDEYFTLTVVNFPVSDIISITSMDVHPPLYYLLLKFVIKALSLIGITSHNLYAVRLVSILPYAIIIVLSYLKIKEDYGWLTAGLFALSIGIMSEFFTHFLIARMYSWAILFLLIAFIYTRDIFTKGDKKSWAIVTAASVLCAYTHYFAAMSAACLYLIIIFYVLTKKKDQIKNLGISIAAAVILYSPWILTLIKQVTAVHNSYWIPQVNLELIVQSFGYFAHGGDSLFAVVAIIILAIIGYLYAMQLKERYTMDNFYILTGLGVYVGTIILALIISVVFKPILVIRYLMPAAAVLWLAISILITKIEDRKAMLYSFALIGLLLVAGAGHMVSTNLTAYDEGMAKEDAFNQIMQDGSSILVLTKPNTIMYFLDYSDRADTYCFNHSYVFGENMNRVHKIFDFKEVSEKNLTSLVTNNTDRNVYIITWGDQNLSSSINKTKIWDDRGIEIFKLTAKEPVAKVTEEETD